MKAAGQFKRMKFLLLVVLLSVLTGCSRYRSTTRPVQIDEKDKNERVYGTNEEAVKAGVYEDFVDSTALKSGEAHAQQPDTAASPPVPPVPAAATPSVPAAGQEPANVMLGFRVQLGAFNDMEAAEALAAKARDAFGGRYPVYVRFYSPYWKVQAGDCATRAQAQSLQNFMRGNGYPDAFIVQAGIKR